jgi:hypothetical protein
LSLFSSALLFKVIQGLPNLHLHLALVLLVTRFLAFQTLLRDLLIVHGVLRLINRVRAWNLLHGCLGSLLPYIKLYFDYVLDFGLDVLLVVRRRCG